jgi:hypothetical protein
MAVHAFPVRTMGSTCSTRDCKMRNNIRNGGQIFSGQNNGLHVLNQRLQSGEQYQTWRSKLFQSEQWAPRAQLDTVLQGTISDMAVQSFPIRTMGSMCSTRHCVTGNNIRHGGPIFSSQNNGLHVLNQRLQYEEQYQKWRSNLFQSEQWAPRAQPETAIWGTVSEIAVQAFPLRTMSSTCSTRECNMWNNIINSGPSFSSQNNGLNVLNQRLRYGEQYQTWRSNLFQS